MTETIPYWVPMLLQGLLLFVQMVLATIVLSKAGRSPYWALATIIPFFYIPMIVVFLFAFTKWPKVDRA